MGVRRKFIRDLAEKVLVKYHPRETSPVDPVKIAKALRIEVKLEKVDDDLSGFLYRDPKTNRAIIGANSRHHENRRKFTVAHELGHFLLHKAEKVHLDERKPGGFILQWRDQNSSTGEDLFEREANLFAAELLMPAKALEKDLRNQDVDLLEDEDFLKDLAKKYGVSVQALTIRLNYLGYIRQ